MKRLAAALAAATIVAAGAMPAAAHHRDKRCTLTVHHPLGTDQILSPLPLPEDTPTDLGFIKVFVNCRH